MYKPVIEQGDVIAVMGRGFVSGLIASFTGPVSHVGIVTSYGTDYDTILVTQALSTVRTLTLRETMAHAKYSYALHCKDLSVDDRLKIATFCLSRIGAKYPYSNIFWQAVKQITHNPRWTEYMDKDTANICSELVAFAYLDVDRDFGTSPRDCTPTDCLHWAMTHDNWLAQPLA